MTRYLWKDVRRVVISDWVEVDQGQLEAFVEKWKEDHPEDHKYAVYADRHWKLRRDAVKAFVQAQFDVTHTLPDWVIAQEEWIVIQEVLMEREL